MYPLFWNLNDVIDMKQRYTEEEEVGEPQTKNIKVSFQDLSDRSKTKLFYSPKEKFQIVQV